MIISLTVYQHSLRTSWSLFNKIAQLKFDRYFTGITIIQLVSCFLTFKWANIIRNLLRLHLRMLREKIIDSVPDKLVVSSTKDDGRHFHCLLATNLIYHHLFTFYAPLWSVLWFTNHTFIPHYKTLQALAWAVCSLLWQFCLLNRLA